MKREKEPCAYCAEPTRGHDHILPRSKGGTDAPENIVPCCLLCNSLAGNKVFESFRSKKEYIADAIQRHSQKYVRHPYGEKLNRVRIEKGLTLEALGVAVGLEPGPAAVKKMNAFFRANHMPRANFAMRIERVLGTSMTAEDYGFDSEEFIK